MLRISKRWSSSEKLDAAIVYIPDEWPNLVYREIFREQVHFVTHAANAEALRSGTTQPALRHRFETWRRDHRAYLVHEAELRNDKPLHELLGRAQRILREGAREQLAG